MIWGRPFQRVKLAGFDFDNHLARDNTEWYHECLHQIVTGRGPSAEFKRRVRRASGSGQKVMAELWPEAGASDIDWLLGQYRKIAAQDKQPTQVIPGVAAALEEVHARLPAIIVTLRTVNLDLALQCAKINAGRFKLVCVPPMSELPKLEGVDVLSFTNKQEALQYAMKHVLPYELEPNEVVYSGDSPGDISAAKAVKAQAVGVHSTLRGRRVLRNERPLRVYRSFTTYVNRLVAR